MDACKAKIKMFISYFKHAIVMQMNYMGMVMKTATIPALRVEPKLREAALEVLSEGETLSNFLEESLRANIERRKHNQAFIERGLIAREQAITTQTYYSASSVVEELKEMLAQAKN